MKKTLLKTGALLLAALMLLVASCRPDRTPSPTEIDLCGDVNSASTWSNRYDGVDYRVTCVITVNADLVIAEGTEIEFTDGAGIVVENEGSLKVSGSPSAPVVLRSSNGLPGGWKGLWFKSMDDNNELRHCVVTGGGQESFNGHDVKANVRVAYAGKLGIVNSTITSSAREGLYIDGLNDDFLNPLRVFSSNTISNNAGLPINTISSTISTLDGTGSTYADNGSQHIQIRGGRVYGDHTWTKNTIPYLVNGPIRAGYYSDIGNLTINPGVVMEFINNHGIAIGEYSSGYLKMTGTPTEHITLTTGDVSAWRGICFQSTNAQNRLSYVDVSRGGSTAFTGALQKKANIVIGGYSAGGAIIENCSVAGSAGYGIFVSLGSTAPTLTNVTYSGNAQANYYVE